MNNLGISFAPLVPAYIVWAAAAVAFAISLLLVLSRTRGALVRSTAIALFLLALANRTSQAEAARVELAERLAKIPGLEVRFVEAGQADGETDGTRLFAGLSAALADVPHDRVAGAILITDGRVHDVPAEAAALGFAAPVHALITGHANERDRRVVL